MCVIFCSNYALLSQIKFWQKYDFFNQIFTQILVLRIYQKIWAKNYSLSPWYEVWIFLNIFHKMSIFFLFSIKSQVFLMWKMKGCPQSSGSNCNIHNPLSNVIAVAKNGEVKKECMYKKAFWVILSRLASFISKPGHNESLTESFSAPRNRKLVIT